jgi:hypothetical protein
VAAQRAAQNAEGQASFESDATVRMSIRKPGGVSASATARSDGEIADEAGGGGNHSQSESNHHGRPPFVVWRSMNLVAARSAVQAEIPGVSHSSPIRYCVLMTQDSLTSGNARRPAGVTFIGVLAYVGGIFDIIGGSMILVLATSAALLANPIPGGLITAIAIIISGVIVLIVAGGLLAGSRLSRLIVSIVSQILAITSGGVGLVVGIVSLLISAIVLSWLWTPRANAFFSRGRTAV